MAIHKVLLVDDEPDIRKIGLLSLRNIGKMQVILSGDGAEAVDLAARELPDVILLDMMMPGLDGRGTLARLRARPETAALPVVFLTATSRQSDIDSYLALGALGVIQKPFDPLRLPGMLRALAGEAQP